MKKITLFCLQKAFKKEAKLYDNIQSKLPHQIAIWKQTKFKRDSKSYDFKYVNPQRLLFTSEILVNM